MGSTARRRRSSWIVLALLLGAVLSLAACGGSRHASKSDRLQNLPADEQEQGGVGDLVFQILQVFN